MQQSHLRPSIRRMKKYTLAILTVALVAMTSSLALAYPTGSSLQEADYSVWGKDLHRWSFGAYTKSAKQLVTMRFAQTEALVTHSFGYIGYDVLRGVTPYLAVGVGDLSYASRSGEFEGTDVGAGVHFNIMDYDILDPFLMENRFRIYGGLLYLYNDEFQELSGSLLFGLLNDCEHTKRLGIHSVEVFGGVLFSNVMGIENQETEDLLGFTAGLDLFVTYHMSIQVSLDHFNTTEYSAGLNVRL